MEEKEAKSLKLKAKNQTIKSPTFDKSSVGRQILISLKKAVRDIAGEELEPQIDIPQDLSHGDFSTNAAMLAFAKLKTKSEKLKTPLDLAEEIVELLNTKYKIPNTFRLIEAKPPGFINFFLSESQIDRQINSLIEGLSSKEAKKPSSQSIVFEFGDLNPFKEPHIGHLRIFSVGEAISRLFESDGYRVIRANYQGDVGLHVAKAIYGILNHESGIKGFENVSNEQKARFLGDAYKLGAEKFETDQDAKKEIVSINNKVYQTISVKSERERGKSDGEIEDLFDLWEKGRRVSLDYFEELYKLLGIKYDKYYFESETAPEGLKIVKKNTPQVFEEDEGALIYRGEKEGLHTRVFVTSSGNPMYEAKDLALAVMKEQDFPDAEKSIILTANEQVDYFKVLLSALGKVDKEIAEKTTHLSVGFVNLKEGKMSSRTGNVVGANWLLEETKKRLKKEFKQVSDEVLEAISTGAVKWSMLKFSRESNISFSIDESIDLAGHSGPYIQYTYARTQSILAKSGKEHFEAKPVKNLEEEEIALARLICQFDFAKNSAADSFSPNILCNYLFTLAQTFNSFYEKKKIIGSGREQERLKLVSAAGTVIKKGLYLLGIEAPERI